jgi:hypothetical protein
MILPRTYERTGGVCMPCANKRWAATQEEDPEGKEALVRLEAEASELFRRWYLVHVDYASQCRKSDPVPSPGSLSDLERSEYHVLRQKMIKFADSGDLRILQLPNRAVILTSAAAGLLAASEVFGGEVESLVLLLTEEHRVWTDGIYGYQMNAPWWFTHCWWTVRKELTDAETDICHKYNRVIPDNYRVISEGLQWGPLFGGVDSELWVVMNNQLEYVQGLFHISF